MDADNTPERRPQQTPGGTVEPANRATVAKERVQTPKEVAGERYELRDPFGEVTYRTNNLPEIVAKADQLGRNQFVAVAEDGKRTSFQKLDGQWVRDGQRESQSPEPSERTPGPTPGRGQTPEATNVMPMPRATKEAAQPKEPNQA